MGKEGVQMAIYRTIPDAEKTEKENQQSEIICAKKQKTYTQEEVLAMLEQVQKGEIEK